MTDRRRLAIAIAATLMTVAVAAAASAAPGQRQFVRVRAATAELRSEAAAIAAGYEPTDVCVELPGVGGMGYHYVNPAYVADGVIDATKPEILVFVPTARGLTLGAVEYFQVDEDQDLTTSTDRPRLFGVDFDGPMEGHEPGMPIHYDLHAWVWKTNPTGVLSPWNPRVSCS